MLRRRTSRKTSKQLKNMKTRRGTELKPLVLDATPIIYLCKIGLSEVFTEFPEKKYTTPKVLEEVVEKGKTMGAPDASIAEQLIKKSIIKVRELTDKELITQLSKISNLHEAEIQVLALARELHGVAIMDESIAREVARIYNINAHGTAYLLLRLFHKRRISKKPLLDAINRMVSAGWRLTAEEYARIMKELETETRR